MRKVAVIGADMKRIGRYPEMMFQDLGWPAIKGAIDDAGLKRDDIQAVLKEIARFERQCREMLKADEAASPGRRRGKTKPA